MKFLTNEEVEALTGYKQKARQAEYLAGLGVPFVINSNGRVVVLAERLDFRPRAQQLNPAWVAEQRSREPQECS